MDNKIDSKNPSCIFLFFSNKLCDSVSHDLCSKNSSDAKSLGPV